MPGESQTSPLVAFDLPHALGTSPRLTIGGDRAVVAALAENRPFPPGALALGDLKLAAETGKDFVFGSGEQRVAFTGKGSAFAGLGLFTDPAKAVAALQLEEQAAGDPRLSVDFAAPAGGRLLMLRWGYALAANAKGSVALGGGVAASFGVDARHEGVFAVVRGEPADTPARDAVRRLLASWRLPREVRSSDDLAPGTWLVSEVDGSLGLSLGATYGYDYSWVRETALGNLTGDVGLKIRLGAAVKLGLQVSGRFAVVVGRASAAPVLRVRLFKLAKKGWDFALNASAKVAGDPGKVVPKSYDDFIAGVFGTHGPQIVEDLRAVRAWTDPKKPPAELLAGAAIGEVQEVIREVTGVDPLAKLADARQKLADLFHLWDGLGDRLAAEVWALVGEAPAAEVDEVRRLAAEVAALADRQGVRAVLERVLGDAGFLQRPAGRWLTAAAPRELLSLVDDAPAFAALRQRASATVEILDPHSLGGALQRLRRQVAKRLDLDQLTPAAVAKDVEKLDPWLRGKLAAFLEEELDLDKLVQVQKAVDHLRRQWAALYAKAREALTRSYSVELAYTYQRATARTALLDVEFDFGDGTSPGLVKAGLRDALAGRFDDVLVRQIPGVRLRLGVLTHGVERHRHLELSLPGFRRGGDFVNQASASVEAVTPAAEGGRLLLYEVKAEDKVTARNAHTSRLALGVALQQGVRRYAPAADDAALRYSYSLVAVKPRATRAELSHYLRPYVSAYFPGAFPAEAGRDGSGSFDAWLSGLDQALHAAFPGHDDFGRLVATLELSVPGTFVGAWLQEHDDADLLRLSKRLQGALKEVIPFYYFQDPQKYRGVDGQTLLVYAALPPAGKVKLRNGRIEVTGGDVYWDWVDGKVVEAMARSAETRGRLTNLLRDVHDRLLSQPGFSAADAARFDPRLPVHLDRIVDAALGRVGQRALRSLLTVESAVVRGAEKTARQVAKLRRSGGSRPSAAVAALAEMGSEVTRTFNKEIHSIYGGDAIRPLGSMLFMEAGRALDPRLTAARPDAVLSLRFVKPDAPFDPAKLLAGEEPAPADLVLQQRLVNLERR